MDLLSRTVSLHTNRGLSETFGERITFLWGNHDIPYWETKKRMRSGNRHDFFYPAGVTIRNSRVHQIFKEWNDAFVSRIRLFQEVNGFLLSHVGVDQSFWPEGNNTEESLGRLEERCREALAGIHRRENALLAAGRSRGGYNPVGGLTWQCWIGDFRDNIPLPQIVGHTAAPMGVRQKGRSFCLDGSQTCYGVIDSEGKLEFRDA